MTIPVPARTSLAALGLSPGTVTGIGSLPFLDVTHALDFVARHCPTVPFWPQLPQLSHTETCIPQTLGPARASLEAATTGPGYVLPAGSLTAFERALAQPDCALSPGDAATFRPFLGGLARNRFPHARAVKGQVTGPITLGCMIRDRLGTPIASDKSLLQGLSEFVAAKAAWQTECLASAGLPVIMLIDEPVLGLLDRMHPELTHDSAAAALQPTIDAIRRAGGVAGVHSCAHEPFDAFDRLSADLVSFDTHASPRTLQSYSAVTDPPILAQGMVPALADLDAVSVEALFFDWLNRLGHSDDVRHLSPQCLVTAGCGLGMVSEETAEASFRLQAALGALIRQCAEAPATGGGQT